VLIGLDYFHEHDPAARRQQIAAFDEQLGLGTDHGLPVVIHTRPSADVWESSPEGDLPAGTSPSGEGSHRLKPPTG